mmetsp:Transcript_23593/g.35859  ORF Transcript_23593/g.35859 Transcript_23593/m.35859 type:complete len:258 (+) Transcript_23593:578-1351(+)
MILFLEIERWVIPWSCIDPTLTRDALIIAFVYLALSLNAGSAGGGTILPQTPRCGGRLLHRFRAGWLITPIVVSPTHSYAIHRLPGFGGATFRDLYHSFLTSASSSFRNSSRFSSPRTPTKPVLSFVDKISIQFNNASSSSFVDPFTRPITYRVAAEESHSPLLARSFNSPQRFDCILEHDSNSALASTIALSPLNSFSIILLSNPFDRATLPSFPASSPLNILTTEPLFSRVLFGWLGSKGGGSVTLRSLFTKLGA